MHFVHAGFFSPQGHLSNLNEAKLNNAWQPSHNFESVLCFFLQYIPTIKDSVLFSRSNLDNLSVEGILEFYYMK